MKKILMGVDFGDARTGLAVSDKLGIMASGAGCIKCEGIKKVAQLVAEEAKNRNVSLIVVGNPINMNGTEGPRSERCKQFASLVNELSGIEVELFDERLTTVSAHKFLSESNVTGKKRKDTVDELSATIILQDFMDRYPSKLETSEQ